MLPISSYSKMVAAGEGAGIMKATFLSRFTPSLMEPEALEAIFVQRERLTQRVLERISNSVLTPSKHHTLLIGPRGIGKTHLIALIYHRIRAMEALSDRLLIAWLREEEWGVTSFLDFLLRIFRALMAEDENPESTERVESLYNLPPDVAEHAGAELLKKFIGDQTLLVLVENLDDLFDGLGDEGQKRLRSYLQENPFCTILATAQSLFNGISLRTSPFYGFFRIHHLEELNLDEATQLLTKISNLEDDRELVSFIQTLAGRARIRAVHHIAGGNHRVYVIFSQFLTRKSLDEFVEPFMRTLDDLTPYYQARMSYLSPQQRKIVEFLCDQRHAVPVREIAQRCFMTHQTASGQLKTLRDMGYVLSESIGRASYYELREPLMRLCIEVKKHRGEPIRLFIEFLRLWYSRAELQSRLEVLQSDTAVEREYLLHAIQAIDEEKAEDPRVLSCLKDYTSYIKKGEFNHALEITEELLAIRGNPQDWFERGYCFIELGNLDEAVAFVNKAIELNPNYPLALLYRSLLLLRLGRLSEALKCLESAAPLLKELTNKLNLPAQNLTPVKFERLEDFLKSLKQTIISEPNVAIDRFGQVLNELKYLLHFVGEAITDLDKSLKQLELGRYEEALSFCDKVIEVNPNFAMAWRERGFVLSTIGRYDEALLSFDKAVELNPDDAIAWNHRGIALVTCGDYDEALVSFDEAITLDSNYASAWGNRAVALGNLGHYDEALEACDKAIELGKQSSSVFFNRAEALLALNHWDEGIAALDNALCQFAHAGEPNTDDTELIVRNLFTSTNDITTWQERIKKLMEIYDKHQIASALGQGLVRSIPALNSPMVGDAAARMWRDVWQDIAGEHEEFQVPLRLLDVSVRYRKTRDKRVLLELPVEERTLLEPLLEVEEPPKT